MLIQKNCQYSLARLPNETIPQKTWKMMRMMKPDCSAQKGRIKFAKVEWCEQTQEYWAPTKTMIEWLTARRPAICTNESDQRSIQAKQNKEWNQYELTTQKELCLKLIEYKWNIIYWWIAPKITLIALILSKHHSNQPLWRRGSWRRQLLSDSPHSA